MLLKYSQQTTQIKASDIEKVKKTLLPYIKHLQAVSVHVAYHVPESLINTPFDEQAFGSCWELKNKLVTPALRYIFVVGSGGSILATKGIYKALVAKDAKPELSFIDYLDTESKNKVSDIFKTIKSSEEYLLIVISKTGKTAEVKYTHFYFKTIHEDINSRTVVITDKDSVLWQNAVSQNLYRLAIPSPVPGRFTAFTAVTVFPLLCAGLDVLSFVEGGMKARTDILADSSKNFLQDFTAISILAKKNIYNLFSLDSRLQDFSFWFKQIYAESLGKEFDLKGKRVNAGITPIYTNSPSDYHSQLQLYLAGPNDKLTLFVTSDSLKQDEFLAKSFQIITTKYETKKRPYVEFNLEKLSEYEFGYLMMFLMIHVILLGVVMGINPFDQPEITSIKDDLK